MEEKQNKLQETLAELEKKAEQVNAKKKCSGGDHLLKLAEKKAEQVKAKKKGSSGDHLMKSAEKNAEQVNLKIMFNC